MLSSGLQLQTSKQHQELTTPVLRLDSKRPKRASRRGLSRKKRRKGKFGAKPRVPVAVIAEVEKQLGTITAAVNTALTKALQPALAGDGVISPAELRDAIQRVRIGVPTAAEPEVLADQNLGKIDKFNRRDIQRSIGIAAPEFSSHIGRKWHREQVALIKSISGKPKQKFAAYLQKATQKQTQVSTIRKFLEQQIGVNSRRSKLIARDSVLSLNSLLTKDRHQRAGIKKYKWRATGHGTRDHHADLDGQIISYNDPPMGGGTGENDVGHAGEGIGCQCQQIPWIPEFN